MNDLRSPLSRARGLGSAKGGTHHFWVQRVSAVALVPLVLWFTVSLVMMAGADHAALAAWIRQPYVTVLLVLLLVAAFYHSLLGVQVVVEDYVGGDGARIATLIVVKLLHWVVGAACVLAVLKIAFGR